MNVTLVPMKESHWPRVREIYLAGINGGNATFETEVPTWEEWDAKHFDFARLVALLQDDVKAWAALSPVSTRAAYRGVAENSVYVAPDMQGRGLGRLLLQAVILESEANGIWTLQTSIFPENIPSIELHRRCGFREVGYRERISKLNGLWRNTVLLERRSALMD